ncbi:DUF6241 domain-containing protein [Pseudalkalibacillus hwajinpoensis]|uniref:DUF6241 domain-containing protein n=1 Tax=Guptibacillus hwajinpoensis TaxID=208199 RepID=UPI00325B0DC7
MPSTKTLVISITAMVVLILGLAYWFIADLDSSLKEEKGITETSAEESDEEIDPARYIDDGENSTLDNGVPTETHFMDTLHGMTHQKVVADKKWTLVEMTDERISNMLATLAKIKGKNEYENYDFYYDTLLQWSNGNFRNSVEVHNRIWRMQGGTIGRAERLMTTEEEKEFVAENF